jgi:hypothetical protein
MTKTATIWASLLILGLLIGGWWLYTENPNNVTSGQMSAETEVEIKTLVADFGQRLKLVSLLSTSTLATDMDRHYGEFLSPELLQAWKANPDAALGRLTSSPWPDRIEIVGVAPAGNNIYTVEGNVIEITSADTPLKPAGVYPITLTVEERGGALSITSVSKGAYSDIPQQVTIEGEWECLPHVDGIMTEECAFGVVEDGTDRHYAVDTALMSRTPVGYSAGTRVRIQGVMVPKDHLSTNMWDKYDIEGIIAATMIEEF